MECIYKGIGMGTVAEPPRVMKMPSRGISNCRAAPNSKPKGTWKHGLTRTWKEGATHRRPLQEPSPVFEEHGQPEEMP